MFYDHIDSHHVYAGSVISNAPTSTFSKNTFKLPT